MSQILENSSGIKVSHVSIEKFRRFENIDFEIGPQLTIIAGQNGTCKSTLLGMICQPFTFSESKKRGDSTYTQNYDGLDLGAYRTITGEKFKSEYSEVFRMSPKHDKSQDHRYSLKLTGECISDEYVRKNGLFVISRWRDKEHTKIRLVTGKGREHNLGSGNFPHPVIYLGLNRLCPLAKCKLMSIDDSKHLSSADKEWFISKHNEILILREANNITEFVKSNSSAKGDFWGPAGDDYSTESCSAGQDNLGQILSAVLSFRHLKSELQEKYQGGIFLIDEFDNTFHSVAQLKLLSFLVDASRELNLQIVLTTHSLDVLRHAFLHPYKGFIKTIYLLRQDSKVVDSKYTSFEDIEANLKTMALPLKEKTKPVTVIFEDAVTAAMFSAIFGRKLSKYVKTYSTLDSKSEDAGSISGDILPHFAQLKIPEFQKVIFVVDGDKKCHENSQKRPNLIALPGDLRPESLIYEMLNNLGDTDGFWSNTPNYRHYNAQVCFNNYLNVDYRQDKKSVKKWFNEQKKYWGRQANYAFEYWLKQHPQETIEFCTKFFTILNTVGKTALSDDVQRSILASYSSPAPPPPPPPEINCSQVDLFG